MLKMLRKFDLIVLFVIALIAGALSVLDFFDVFPAYSPNYPLVTLLLLALIGVHLIVSHYTYEEFRTETTGKLLRITTGIQSVGVTEYKDSMEIEGRLAKAILGARVSVCDLTWKARISEGFSATDRQLSHTYMDKCIAEVSERVPYREVFVFSDPRRVAKLNRRLEENKKGYSCKYFESDSRIPRLQFVIVDDREVFFFASSADSVLCSVDSPELAKVFKSFYEAIWTAAVPIKTGPSVDSRRVDQINEVFREE